MKANDYKKYLIPGAIVIGALLLVSKFFGKGKEESDTEKDIASAGKPSYTDTIYNQFAESIQAANLNHFFTDSDSIASTFNQLHNDADYLKLIQAFGKRRTKFSLTLENLDAFLHDSLNDTQIKRLNSILSGKGLKSRV